MIAANEVYSPIPLLKHADEEIRPPQLLVLQYHCGLPCATSVTNRPPAVRGDRDSTADAMPSQIHGAIVTTSCR